MKLRMSERKLLQGMNSEQLENVVEKNLIGIVLTLGITLSSIAISTTLNLLIPEGYLSTVLGLL